MNCVEITFVDGTVHRTPPVSDARGLLDRLALAIRKRTTIEFTDDVILNARLIVKAKILP